ncbi:MAG TPA: Rrf2 family transcriptional regulator [Gemmatimonadales bacterium]|nr:Rrf2 family transcriptional regulator [Gemmatimonadales bacterium]
MWLNTTAQTALRAVLYIAEQGAAAPIRVDDIAKAVGGPRNYLSKTLHVLAREGVLRSSRGPGGGFQLVEPPAALTLARVIGPFEPADDRRCLVGRPHCGDANPCQAHRRWSSVAHQVESFFGDTTIADLFVAPVQLTRARHPAPSTRKEPPHARSTR